MGTLCDLRKCRIESRRPSVVGPRTYDVPMQTNDNTEQPTVHDGLDELFAAVLEDERSEGELPAPCCVSRGEILSIQDTPVIEDGGLLAAFQE